MIEVRDFVDVEDRSKALGLSLLGDVTFLPRHFADAGDADMLVSETDGLDLGKLLHDQGIDVGIAKRDGETLPLIVENDAFVHLPDLLITGLGSASVTVILGVVANYVYNRLVGMFSNPQVKFSIVTKAPDGGYKRISYEGPVEGLSQLKDAIENVAGTE